MCPEGGLEARAKRAVLFDMDGTLIDSLGDIAASLNHILSEAGLPTHPLAD